MRFISELTTWQLDFYRHRSTHPSFQLKTSGWTLTFLSCPSGKRNTKAWSMEERGQGWKARAKPCILVGSLLVPVFIWQEGHRNLGFSIGESKRSTSKVLLCSSKWSSEWHDHSWCYLTFREREKLCTLCFLKEQFSSHPFRAVNGSS